MCLSFRSPDVHTYNTYSENINPPSRLLEGYHRYLLRIPYIRLEILLCKQYFQTYYFTHNYLAYLIFFNHLVAYKFKNFIIKMNNKTVFLPACGCVEEVRRVCAIEQGFFLFCHRICKPTFFVVLFFYLLHLYYTPKRGCQCVNKTLKWRVSKNMVVSCKFACGDIFE